MNVREIKKSIIKMKQVKELMKSRENNISVFYAHYSENSNERRIEKEKSTDMEAKGTNKTLKISAEHDGNAIKITKIIVIIVFLIIFLSNFAVASFYITFNAEKSFRHNLKSA